MPAWDQETIDLAMRTPEIEFTTWGRKSGQPRRVIIWIWGDGQRLFVRSSGGFGRDWTQNLRARNEAIVHLAGRDIPVRARHVTDPAEARACSHMVVAKYPQTATPPGTGSEPTLAEQATFEIFPATTD